MGRLTRVFVFGFLLLSFVTGCEAAREDVKRVHASGLSVEAVLVERNAGATVDFWYEVYLVPRGERVSRSTEPVLQVMWAGPPESIALEWTAPRRLTIKCCAEAVIMRFTNRWSGKDAEGGWRTVAVELQTPNGKTPPLPQRAAF
jgi:hypothetical protein